MKIKVTIRIKRLMRVNPEGWLRWINILCAARGTLMMVINDRQVLERSFHGKIGTEGSPGSYVVHLNIEVPDEDMDKPVWVMHKCDGIFEYEVGMEMSRD